MKFYVCDNDIILTGANLSENYFTERQDRYFLIKAAPELANYLEDLLNVIANNSSQVEENGALSTVNKQPSALDGKKFKEVFDHQFRMFLFSNKLSVKKVSSALNKKTININNNKALIYPF